MYSALVIFVVALTLLYSLLILLYRRWFLELPEFQMSSEIEPNTRFSVIIPARNEAENIDRFLPSILEQNYPTELFEVIVINDHSTDETAQRIQNWQSKFPNLHLIELSEHLNNYITKAYKKKAIEIAKKESGRDILVIDVEEKEFDVPGEKLGKLTYEKLLSEGDPNFVWQVPADEWQAICLNYTSGTTGNPKGVVYHHRGAAINAISNVLDWDINKHPVYLWTLPMFHCNGWCFPWTIAARAGVNVCLRRVDAQHIFAAIKEYGVTHYCAAPIVHNLLVNAPDELKVGMPKGVKGLIAGAAPPASIIEGMEKLGFDLTHVYGLTEVYGPAAVCVKQYEWNDLDIGERARLNARQGVRYHMQQAIAVLNSQTMEPVPADGETMGEIMFKGNIAMKGYLKNDKATQEAFEGGWFHSGDLAVMNPDGYIKIKDRSKDIIISGGENISSIEVEDVLYRHPAVIAAAVVAKPDPKWGETPCAFLEIKPGVEVTAAEIIAHCKQHLAGFKVPKVIVFGELPKTSTGKIQKFELRKQAGSAAAIDV
jgi:fatty-acyl-CoA synthase